MSALLRHRVTPIWLMLILATALSWQFGHGLGFGAHIHLASVAVIAIALLKVRYIFLDFMELRTAPLPLRLIFEGWILVVGGALVTLYWRGAV